jgi:hypothetical protein
MTWRSAGYHSDARRVRTGLIVLLAGIVILLAAVGMLLLRNPEPSPDQTSASLQVEQSSPPDLELSRRVGVVAMVMGGVLVITLLITAYALFRITRRFATVELGKPAKPTATEDVWQMHKVPEEAPGDEKQEEGAS